MKLLIRKLIIIWDELRFCWMVLFAKDLWPNWANQSDLHLGKAVKVIAHKMNLLRSASLAPAQVFVLANDIIYLLARVSGGCYFRMNASGVKVKGDTGDWILVVKQLKKKEKRR